MRRLCTEGSRTYLGRSAACRGSTTETAVKQLSAPQKSAEGIVISSDEGPNGSQQALGLKSKQVGSATHER